MRAFGENAFDISPKIAEIEAPFGGQIRYPVRIEYYTNAAGSVVFDRIETDVPHFKAGNATTEEFRKGGTRIVRVTVPLIYNAPEKSTASTAMSGEVKFIFTANNQVKAVPMRLNASIGSPPFRPIPEKVFLIASSSIEALQARIAIELPAEVRDDAIEVTPASSLPVLIVKTKVSQSRYLVTLTISSSSIALMDPGLTRSSVAITLKQKDRAYFVTVPVNIFRPATQPTKVE